MNRNIIRFYKMEDFKKINNYVLIRSLGKENIFLALNIRNFDYVVVKSFDNKEDFIRERNCLQKISNICYHFTCLIDSFKYENLYYIVTNYLREYITLFDYFSNYSRQKQRDIAAKIERLIKEMHENNVSHQDLHSKNIMIHPETLDVKIIDFGECSDYNPDDLGDFEILELLSN
jgi:serine/threonine protein kinase